MEPKTSPEKKSIFREPVVIVALIGLIGTVITVIGGPIVVNLLEAPTATPMTAPVVLETVAVPTPTYFQSAGSETYAIQLLSEARNWTLVAFEPFDTNQYGWLEDDVVSSSLEASHKIETGQYFLRIKGLVPIASRWGNPSKVDPIQDFYASLRVQRISDLGDLRTGLIFRYQGNRIFYSFLIYMDGHFQIRYYDDNDATPQTSNDFAYLPTTLINPSASNKLTVIGRGNDYWFYINDQFVHYLNDAQLAGGTVGLFVGVKEIGQDAQVAFDDFELRKAP